MSVTIVTAGIIEKNDQILIARRAIGSHLGGLWEFPGGKLEAGETNEECLARELFEEFEINVLVGEYVADSFFDYKEKKIRLMAYKVKYVSGSFVLNNHSEIRWIDIFDTDSFEFAPADLPIIEVLKKGRNN